MIHLEGMGALGAQAAHALDERGYEFTWHDTDAEIVAYRASTGGVYPDLTDPQSESGYQTWMGRAHDPRYGPETVEKAPFLFNTKNPPHGNRWPSKEVSTTGLRRADELLPGVTVNVQRLVFDARKRYADRRSEVAPDGTRLYVVCHGFDQRRIHRHVWGWSAPVYMTFDDRLPERPFLYFRAHRYQLAYAYPIPGSPRLWWAGSHMISQGTPRRYPDKKLFDYFETWSKLMFTLSGMAVTDVELAGDIRQGWRPKAAKDDPGGWLVESVNGHLLAKAPCMGANGIRLGPPTVAQLVGIADYARRQT